MRLWNIGKLGSDEGKHTGPPAGDGASSVGGMVAGGTDIEGTPPDALPQRPGPDDADAKNQKSPDNLGKRQRFFWLGE
jgi:hypothetical protein